MVSHLLAALIKEDTGEYLGGFGKTYLNGFLLRRNERRVRANDPKMFCKDGTNSGGNSLPVNDRLDRLTTIRQWRSDHRDRRHPGVTNNGGWPSRLPGARILSALHCWNDELAMSRANTLRRSGQQLLKYSRRDCGVQLDQAPQKFIIQSTLGARFIDAGVSVHWRLSRD